MQRIDNRHHQPRISKSTISNYLMIANPEDCLLQKGAALQVISFIISFRSACHDARVRRIITCDHTDNF
jgi:hypothetical protein